MKSLKTNRASAVISLLLACSMAVGCTAPASTASSQAAANASSSDLAPSTSIVYDPKSPTGGLTLPLTTEDITLTCWIPLNDQAKGILQSYNDNLAMQEITKRTGVKIDFQHPPIGQEAEQYKLMISSNDLPDIIEERGTSLYPGGGDKAVSDGVFIKLNDLVENHAPNYRNLRSSAEQVEKLTITDMGNIWSFPMVQNFDALVWSGPIIRKDYLDSMGLQPPQTIEEWYNVLTVMKKNNVEIPLLFPEKGTDPYGCFLGSYGIAPAFFVENGTVKYGRYDPRAKDYFTEMNRWYNEGLIDKDFPSRDAKMLESLSTSGKAGAWISSSGIGIERYIIAGRSSNPDYNLYGAPYPKQLDGSISNYRQVDWKVRGYNAAITTSCKYPELAVSWLDYRYSPEGTMLTNYGLEGTSFKFDDKGEPVLLDKELMALPEHKDMAFSTIMWKYKLNDGAVNRMNTAPLHILIPESQQARPEWGKSATANNVLPPLTLSPEEASEYSSLMNDINTYLDQMTLKFIIGAEPLSSFDSYIAQLDKMNIKRAIEIQQTAYDRFLKR